MNKCVTCEEVYGQLIPTFISTNANPLYALSSLLVEAQTNAELYKILVTDNEALTKDYILNRYDKIMSPLFMRLYEKIHDEDLANTGSDLADIIKMKYFYNWNKLAEAVFSDYNPIDNYNMIENRNTDFEEHTVDENTTTNRYSGFNADDMKDVSETAIDGDITKTDTGNKLTNELTRRGNIGVTTTAQMIEGEYKLRKKNILDIIYRDIDNILFIDYYK